MRKGTRRVSRILNCIPHTRARPHSPNDHLWDRHRLAIDARAWLTCAHKNRERVKDAAVRAEHRRKDEEGAHSQCCARCASDHRSRQS
jgi:hypothetical protein